MLISVNTRQGWSQRVSGLSAVAVRLRMQRIAAHESIRRPLSEVIVTATDKMTGEQRYQLHWPTDDLAYWVLGDQLEALALGGSTEHTRNIPSSGRTVIDDEEARPLAP